MARMQKQEANPPKGRMADAWGRLEDAIGSEDDVKPTSTDGFICVLIIAGAFLALWLFSQGRTNADLQHQPVLHTVADRY